MNVMLFLTSGAPYGNPGLFHIGVMKSMWGGCGKFARPGGCWKVEDVSPHDVGAVFTGIVGMSWIC